MGCAVHISGPRAPTYGGSAALVKVDIDGTISVITGETDVGQGSQTVFAQIAAEVLGARVEDVRVPSIDTSVMPNGGGSYASRVTFVGGNAVRVAAEDARRQVLTAAESKLEANADDLSIIDSRVYMRGSPDRSISLAETARANLFRSGGSPIIGRGAFDPGSKGGDPKTMYGDSAGAYGFAAHVAEVNVDAETGQVEVLNFVAAQDAGRAINPMAVEGQVEGSVAQGLGYALTEEMLYDGKGAMLNPNLSDYGMPTAMDVPASHTIIVEPYDPLGPFGAKGVGEVGISATAPAVANAIYNAVGVRIMELPITAEKVFKALREKAVKRLE